MKRKFWNWIRNEDESVPDMERTLFLNGMISDETWYGDEVTPQLFKDELNAGNGNITVWINSPGFGSIRDRNGRRHGLCIPCCNDDDPIGTKEEEAFFIGDGKGKPTGIFNATGGAETGVTSTGTSITFDDVMDLYYSSVPHTVTRRYGF